MKFGLFSNGYRMRPIARDSYQEDLQEIVTADRLGFDEAWVSEHITLRPDGLPVPEMLFCKAAALTERIRFGAAIRILPIYHPLDVAMQAVVCDHLTDGRYNFGFGVGAPAPWIVKPRGIDVKQRHAMMVESLDFIQRAWTTTEPFDFEGQFWQSRDIRLYPKPLQQPHPPIAVATRTPELLQLAGRNGWVLLNSHYHSAASFRRLTAIYLDAGRAAGHARPLDNVSAALAIYVSDSVEQAKREIRDGAAAEMEELAKHPEIPHFVDFTPPSGRYSDITFDFLYDAGMFYLGDPDTVFAGIERYYQECGGFGRLQVVVGKEWSTSEKRARSLELFMKHVAPRVARLGAEVAAPVG